MSTLRACGMALVCPGFYFRIQGKFRQGKLYEGKMKMMACDKTCLKVDFFSFSVSGLWL